MGTRRSSFDGVRRVIHGSGLAWWTPLVGKQDAADLEYLRASILRDLEWVGSFDELATSASLQAVQKELASLLRPISNATFAPVVYPWHVPSGWTDYGGIRLALLAALPVEAHEAALEELRSMEALVLSGSRPRWRALATDLEADITNPATAHDPKIPHKLCALWREVDFGRNYWRVRTAKNTTITALTWSVILAATITLLVVMKPRDQTNICLVALLGLLGGAMSALRSTDLISGERRSIEIEAARVRLRPVVGAAMAVVIYVIGQSGLAFELVTTVPSKETTDAAKAAASAPIQIRVPDVAWGYYALAFVAGFAERWFLKIIDLVEGRFDSPPPTPATKAGGSNPPSSGSPQPSDLAKDAATKADAAKAAVAHAATTKAAAEIAAATRDDAIEDAERASEAAKAAAAEAEAADAATKDKLQKAATAKREAATAAAAKADTARKAATKAQAANDAAQRDVGEKQAAATAAASKAAAAKAVAAKALEATQAKDAAAKVTSARVAVKAAEEKLKAATDPLAAQKKLDVLKAALEKAEEAKAALARAESANAEAAKAARDADDD